MLTDVKRGERKAHWYTLVVVSLSLLFLGVPALGQGAGEFVHPGLLATKRRLYDFKIAANADQLNAQKDAYRLVLDDPRSSSDYRPNPQVVVEVASFGTTPSETAIKDDAMAAYLNALRWVQTGRDQYRHKAIEILNAWAARFRAMKVVARPNAKRPSSATQAQLESAWALPLWLNAAEIIRYYPEGAVPWHQEDVTACDRFATRLYDEARRAQVRRNNWGAAAAMATIAIGIYQNDRQRYAQGLRATKELLTKLISKDGEVFELRSRDCGHPQYTLTAFVQAAAMVANQGDPSIWLTGRQDGSPVLARGLEYMARALTEGSPARDCRLRGGKMGTLQNAYGDIAMDGYRELGVPLPLLSQVVRQKGPDGASYQFLGWSSVLYSRRE